MQDNLFLFRQALALTSGTMSYRINCTRYDVVDAVQREFAEFCLENPHYENWVLAWNDFEKVANVPAMVERHLTPRAVDGLCPNCGRDYFENETIVDGELRCSCARR